MNRITLTRATCVRSTAAAIALAAALSACSGNSNDNDGGTAAGDGGAYVDTSQSLLDTAEQSAITGPAVGTIPAEDLVAWTSADIPAPAALPSDPVDVAVITVYPVGFPIYGADLIKTIGGDLGWNVRAFQAATPDAQGAQAAINQAILTKPDAIVTLAVPAPYVAQGLATAKSKGISTVAIHGDAPNDPGFDAYVPASEGVQKALIGAYAVAQSEGAGEVMVVSSPPFGDANVKAAEEYVDACSGCTLDSVQFSPDVFNDQTKMPSQLSAAVKSPSVDFVVFPNGSIPLDGALNGIKASRSRDAQMLINNPGPPTMQYLADGRIPVAVNVPYPLLVLTALDQVNRLVAGQAPLAGEDLRMPVSYWTKADGIEPTWQAMTAAQIEANDYVTPFQEAWGVADLKTVILDVEG